MRFSHFAIVPALFLAASVACAGELKVDINRDGKNSANQTAAGYVQWTTNSTGGTASSGTNAITQTFGLASTGETVRVSLAMTPTAQAAGGLGLTYTYYAAGTTTEGQKLVSDGISVDPRLGNAGGQILMTVTGLNAGAHSLLTFHNIGDAATDTNLGTVSPIKVFLNGSLAASLTPSIRATDATAPTVYLNFTTASSNDITTVLFAADTLAQATTKNVVLNGFEIDTSNGTRIAGSPAPTDGDEHVDADSRSVVLSWSAAAAGNGATHDVYLGTSYTEVRNANRLSALYLGNQVALTRTVSTPNPHATYYWRVDEVDSLGNSTPGTVWSFRPRVLAFPGAEGYGRFARGGRGGKVVKVTSLADYASGSAPVPGTLRYAVEVETGPRTIVFDVGGLITLDHRLTLASPYVTVAGHTAPGKGICLRGWALGLSGARDAIVRFIRNRPGNISGQTIDGGGLAGCDHAIMDHCSISWSIDEGFSGRSAKNITLQRTLISEALNIAGHANYPAGTAHGYAATIGGDKGSYHHNLLAHCEGRNWSLGGGLDANGYFAGRLDIRNNVVYNWRGRTTDGGAMQVNFVSNYYKPGAAARIFTALNAQYDNFPGTQQYYMAGNVMSGYFSETNQAAGRTAAGYVPTGYPIWVDAPFFDHQVTTQSALGAYKSVLSDVGANRPQLDEHDTRVIRETLAGTYTFTGTGPYGGYPGLPNSQDDVGGWEYYPTVHRSADWDSDGDGLPDWWEAKIGTNPNSPPGDFSDANADPENDGYTRLDDYLAWLAAPNQTAIDGADVDIDMRSYCLAYTNSPSFQVAVAPASAGTVRILSDGYTARFTPATGYSGEAQLSLVVTDAVGDSSMREVRVQVPASHTSPGLVLRRSGGLSSLELRGPRGFRYMLEHSTNLRSWTALTPIEADGTSQQVDVPETLNQAAQGFFRIR